jgi:hypothetical protein
MSHEDPSDKSESQKRVENWLKKAVELGAGAYVSAEQQIQKTIHTAQIPFKEMVETFFEHYTVHIKAELSFKPKNPELRKPVLGEETK